MWSSILYIMNQLVFLTRPPRVCQKKNKHTENQVKVSSLCPNVLLLLHSLFNEYSERQINTDRTAAKRRKKRRRRKPGGEGKRCLSVVKSKGRKWSSRTTADPLNSLKSCSERKVEPQGRNILYSSPVVIFVILQAWFLLSIPATGCVSRINNLSKSPICEWCCWLRRTNTRAGW